MIGNDSSKAETNSSERNRRLCSALVIVPALFMLIGSGVAVADEANCGQLKNAFGPFDYRDPAAQGESLGIVEAFHFTSNVENLISGQSGTVPGDLDYTLRAFPNHHRALYSASQWAARGLKPPLVRSIECYFDRARRMAPGDPMVLVVQGIYFSRTKRSPESIKAYREALAIDSAAVEAHYNLGLELVETGQLAEANRHAQIAYRSGYPLAGLRNRLQRLGAWNPQAVPSPDPSSGESPAP